MRFPTHGVTDEVEDLPVVVGHAALGCVGRVRYPPAWPRAQPNLGTPPCSWHCHAAPVPTQHAGPPAHPAGFSLDRGDRHEVTWQCGGLVQRGGAERGATVGRVGLCRCRSPQKACELQGGSPQESPTGRAAAPSHPPHASPASQPAVPRCDRKVAASRRRFRPRQPPARIDPVGSS